MHRPTLGVISLILIAGGAIFMLRPVDDDPYAGAVAFRAGLVLGAVWFALPNIRRVPRWLIYGMAVVAAVLIVRPRLLLYSLPAAALVASFAAMGGSRRGSSGGS